MGVQTLALSIVLVIPLAAAAAEPRPATAEPTYRVRVTLSPPRDLPDERLLGIARRVDEIWRPYGVELVWDRGDAVDPVPARTWVLVLVRPDNPGDPDPLPPSFPLGSLHRRKNPPANVPKAVIFTTLARIRTLAWHAVDDVKRFGHGNPPSSLVDALLARVIAHELGHYLLETDAHSATGLMRDAFVSRDAVAPGGDRYALTGEQRRTLRAALAARTGTLVAER